jgi:hypothetical protein
MKDIKWAAKDTFRYYLDRYLDRLSRKLWRYLNPSS